MGIENGMSAVSNSRCSFFSLSSIKRHVQVQMLGSGGWKRTQLSAGERAALNLYQLRQVEQEHPRSISVAPFELEHLSSSRSRNLALSLCVFAK